MPRRKRLVNDIDSPHPHLRQPARALVTNDTSQALSHLTALLTAQRCYVRKEDVSMTKRESERAFQNWLQRITSADIRARAARISMSASREKAYEYLREEFYKAHPEAIPNTRQGRPDWYIARGTQEKIAQGEIIARLLNLAGGKLEDELLSTSARSAA